MTTRTAILSLGAVCLLTLAGQAAAPPPRAGISSEALPESRRSYYRDFVTGEARLHDAVDRPTFDRALQLVRTSYLDRLKPGLVWRAVAREVRELLLQEAVPTVALTGMPRDATLPDRILKAYGSRLSTSLLLLAMTRGTVSGLRDPGSGYHPVLARQRMGPDVMGGIGVTLFNDPDNHGRLTVLESVDATPARRAGVRAGDVLLQIDRTPCQGMTPAAAALHIRGPVNSPLKLTVKQGGYVTVARMMRVALRVPEAEGRALDTNLAGVRIRWFDPYTARRVLDLLTRLHPRGLVLDLRDCDGEEVNAAIDVCSAFLPAGQAVATVRSLRAPPRAFATRDAHPWRLPVVVLTNRFTYASAEVVAGCLHDAGVETVGMRSGGHGRFHESFPLPSGTLTLSTGRYFTPRGRAIDRVGLAPDVACPMRPTCMGGTQDVQMARALFLLQRRLGKAADADRRMRPRPSRRACRLTARGRLTIMGGQQKPRAHSSVVRAAGS